LILETRQVLQGSNEEMVSCRVGGKHSKIMHSKAVLNVPTKKNTQLLNEKTDILIIQSRIIHYLCTK